jgi:glucose/arabinose dehydrogenase
MNKINSLILISLILLTGCQFPGISADEPPLPTIVSTNPTSTPVSEATVIETVPPATDLPAEPSPTPAQASANDTLDSPTDTPVTEPTPTPTPEPATPEIVTVPPLDSLEVSLTPIADGLERPNHLTYAGDGSGRQFVVEQPGRIRVIKDGNLLPTPFLDIVSVVGSEANEQGLLSVAFHPDYAINGYFFVNYTNKDGDTTISRYQVSDDPDLADPGSAKILLTIGQPYGNHNGGQILFGPDGYLYVGMGDGGAANDPHDNGQKLDTLLGKILRIDVDNADPYGAPQDNPFINETNARPEIWSYGWRNPWRISFDSITGDMYIADVGQNKYEEVHVELAGAPGGQNYGWRLMEGFHCFNPAECDPASLPVELPVTEYDHAQGCSITGGYVYRGANYPELTGTYLYGDYCSGLVWGLRLEADGSWSNAQLLPSNTNISSFGQDEAGEIYLIDHRGTIYQIVSNQ